MVRIGGLGLQEGSKRDSSTAQADSFADEREEKEPACSGRNNPLVTSPDRCREAAFLPARPWLSSWLLRISWRGCLLCCVRDSRSRGIYLRDCVAAHSKCRRHR